MNIQLKSISWLSLALALSSAPAWGCGDDDESQPTITDGGHSQAGTGGGKKDGGTSDKTDGGGGKGGSGGDDTENAGHSGSGGDGDDKDGGTKKPHTDGGGLPDGDGGVTCTGPDGCYACDDKSSDEQFLNQCTDSQSEPFDNNARIEFKLASGKNWKQGDKLPAIP